MWVSTIKDSSAIFTARCDKPESTSIDEQDISSAEVANATRQRGMKGAKGFLGFFIGGDLMEHGSPDVYCYDTVSDIVLL